MILEMGPKRGPDNGRKVVKKLVDEGRGISDVSISDPGSKQKPEYRTRQK